MTMVLIGTSSIVVSALMIFALSRSISTSFTCGYFCLSASRLLALQASASGDRGSATAELVTSNAANSNFTGISYNSRPPPPKKRTRFGPTLFHEQYRNAWEKRRSPCAEICERGLRPGVSIHFARKRLSLFRYGNRHIAFDITA